MSLNLRHVNIQEAKNNFSKLLVRANAGEEITICKAGKPYAKLVAIEQPKQRELGFLKDSFTEDELITLDRALAEPTDENELKLWYDAPIIQTMMLADRENPDEDGAS